MVDGAKPLRVGNVCYSEARIASVTNTDAGKVVKVKGHVYRAGTPVIEVVSAFLYRGRFTDYENTFETTEEPDYLVDLFDDAAVGVLQPKEWFDWDDQSVPLQAGIALFFLAIAGHLQRQNIISKCVCIRRHIRPRSIETVHQGRIGGLTAG
jgi:fatty acid synthase subunit alpha